MVMGNAGRNAPRIGTAKKVTQARPELGFACNKKYEQCGGGTFSKNPCCEKGLVCHGDKPKYYMQCIPKFELEKKTKKSETSDDALDDDDDGDIELSALPSGLLEEHQEEEKAD